MRRFLPILVVGAWAVACLIVLLWCYKVATFYKCEAEDIFYAYSEGRSILEGKNPYSRIHDSDMLTNAKYATYLPGAYLLSAAAQHAGLTKFSRWLRYWRKVLFMCHVGIAALLFIEIFGLTRSLGACMLACTIWLFNRWSLFVERVSHLDHLPLLLFMLGLTLRRRYAKTAWIFYGMSLAIKQMAVFAVPILLIEAWIAAPRDRRVKEMLKCVAFLAVVPVAVSLPFLVADAPALVKSVMFSVTRQPNQHLSAAALLDSMGFTGAITRLPLFVMLAATYALFWTRRITFYPALCLQFVLFLYFNPVLYRQYFLWPVPFVLLTIFSVVPVRTTALETPRPTAA
ncbi:MAG: hypothetical protein ACR2IE_17535 [Candidatus Sumerlaeaceae bacterium]